MTDLVQMNKLKPAAQYLRMSTENQRYSLANQAAAIEVYALSMGYNIVRTYTDSGKSGLTIKRREGLKALIGDVISGVGGYEAVLVLDVSRWGRFQDPDQGAHYEFVCREAGVAIHYCAEPFQNDGTVVSSIVKNVKRLMAAEYSRDLSERIRRTKRRAALAGFVQGGPCPYALQRIVVDHLGQVMGTLRFGQQKISSGYRVVYGLGAPSEVSTVAKIFRLYVKTRLSPRAIAETLNRSGILGPHDALWTGPLVRRILTCSTYCGEYIYGRRAQFLKSPPINQPTEKWIRIPTPTCIVTKRTFAAAQALLKKSKQIPLSRDELLQRLRRLLQMKGELRTSIIDACEYLPAAHTCFEMFGGASKLYRLLNYEPPAPRFRRMTSEQIISALRQLLAEHGYLTTALVSDDPRLPSATAIVVKFGSIRAAFAAAGYARSLSEINREVHFRASGGRYRITPRNAGLGDPKDSELCMGRDADLSKEKMVERLRSLWLKRGFVSASAINEDAQTPPVISYRRAFGSLTAAYAMAGLPTEKGDQLKARFEAIPKSWQRHS